MTTPLLTPEEKARVRYHLGYPNVEAIYGYQLGIPAPMNAAFLVEGSMDRIIEAFIPKVREFLDILDDIECQMVKGQKYLAADRVGDIEVRKEHIQSLEREYTRWAKRLADTLGVPLYPFSTKFGSGKLGNVPVRG